MTTRIYFCVLFLTIQAFAYGQGLKIEGTVTAEDDGQPLAGASVVLLGTNRGVNTDAEGKFQITLNKAEDSLQISYYGYLSQVVKPSRQRLLNIQLVADAQSLDDVVVIGYGRMRKSDLTGSVYSVRGDDLVKNPAANPLQALQGKVPGVQISSASGNPGESPIVRIRGIATLLGGAGPVFVVDGVILDDISFLNSGDIESIEVLKDASATAIYGTRGANGVIIISTKRGVAGKPRVQFSASHSLESVANQIDLLNGREFAAVVNEIAPATYNNIDLLPNVDWQDLIFQDNAPIQQYELSTSGAEGRHSYYLGGSYYRQEGVIERSAYERITLKLNNSFKATSFLTLGNNLTFSQERKEFGPNVVASAYRAWPTNEPLDDEGNFLEVMGSGNPIAALNFGENYNRRLRAIANLYAEVKFLKDFTFRSSYQADLAYTKSTFFSPVFFVSPTQQNETSDLAKTARDEATWIFENTLRYNKNLENHRFEVLAGYTAQSTKREGLTGTIENLLRERPEFYYLDAGDGTTIDAFNNLESFAYISYLFRFNYVLKDRYLFTATFRRDGSSKFGPENRYGNFPALALGWRLSEEPFLQSFSALSNLKLRASWGINGNDQIPFRSRFARVNGNSLEAVFGQDESLFPGATLADAGNPDLQWEDTETIDIGLEFGFFDNKLTGEIDYFNKRTNRVLVPLLLPAHFGNGPFRRVVFNAADIRNVGLEFFVNWKEQRGDFVYSISLLGSRLRNETLDIGAADEFIQDGSLGNGQLVTRTETGIPVGSFYGFKVAGVFQNEEELGQFPTLSGQRVGDLRYEDINGDGTINTDDRTILGSYIPDYLFGFNFSVGYKGFTLDADIQGQQGNEIYNGKRAVRPELYNYEGYIRDRWTGEGTSDTQPRLTTGGVNYSPSDWFIEDGSFLRLRSLTLSYDFSSSLVRRLRMQDVRLFLRGTNLYTLSRFSGYSPELASANVLSSGIDLGTYPITSVYTIGLNISL
ncbi:MAG: TonB-dependent receptor [Bacteroidota bacterium]